MGFSAAFTSPLLPRHVSVHASWIAPHQKRFTKRPVLKACTAPNASSIPRHVSPIASATSTPPSTPQFTVEIARSVSSIPAAVWNTFVTCPFHHHTFLLALEETECATASTGWTPCHLIFRQSDHIVALAPAYLKAHSMGEFVFDQDWAEASYAMGIAYYPKLLLAIPFTPVTGSRILTKDNREEILPVAVEGILRAAQALGVGSIHVNFCNQDEIDAFKKGGFLERKGVQYHFVNERKGEQGGYRDFEEYLGEFKSKRRIKMRREREKLRECGVQVEVVHGDGVEAMMGQMYRLYESTIDKMVYGRRYLTRRFFHRLAECEEFRKHVCVVVAKKEGKVVGGTFNIVDGDVFYGRYWGCVEEVRFLHFETCYYKAIEFCIENGLSRMEPGAGGGEFKFMRGFEPSVTTSMHFIRDKRLKAAVGRFLQLETDHVHGAVQIMTQDSAIRAKARRDQQQTSV